MNDKQLNHAIISQTIDAGLMIVRLLGGNGLVGLALVEALYTDNPWRSPLQVSQRIGVSDDTARRLLKDLVGCGRSFAERRGKTVFYRVCPDIAEKIVNDLKQLEQVNRVLRSTATCGEPGVAGSQDGS